MEDTLRYFFSAMFQGFAALIALGAMFYLYYKEISFNKMQNLENELRKFLNVNNDLNVNAKIDSEGIESYTQNHLNGHKQFERRNTVEVLFDNYKNTKRKREKVKFKLPRILNYTIIILIVSITSLFLVDYNYILDKIILMIGILLIIFSIITLIMIKKFILTIIKS